MSNLIEELVNKLEFVRKINEPSMVCLSVKFLKSELNFYSVCEFRGLTFLKKLNKILFV
jgi:hypothetical protein